MNSNQPSLEERLLTLEQKIDAIYISVEKTRKYFLWTLIFTVVAFILPLIGLLIAIPSFLSEYTKTLSGTSGF